MSKQEAARIALVTGAGRGLGRSMANHLAERGTDLVVTYRSSDKEAAEVVAAAQELGRKAVALRLDVADSRSFGAFAEAVQAKLKEVWQRDRFDFLVNNAGIGAHASFAETSEQQFDELVATNMKGPFFLAQRLLPLIADGGRVLNVSSGLARFSFPGYAAYAMTKGGIEVLTRYMAKELGGRGSPSTPWPRAPSRPTSAAGRCATTSSSTRPSPHRGGQAVGLPDDIGRAALRLPEADHWAAGGVLRRHDA
ncbi:MAG: SDR family NAD(P)-dependent oxidoreductase [Polyangiaceae bacterium]